MSHSARSQCASASAPSYAVTTSKYSAESRASSSFTLAATSSTTRMRAVIDAPSACAQEMANGLDEFAHRDRLGEIGLAASLPDSLFVAFHGESSDGHNRDSLKLGVVLEPFGHFKARHFRKLNVHQDQIRLVLARKIKRFDPVARAYGLVTMRFKQIVEELHVE